MDSRPRCVNRTRDRLSLDVVSISSKGALLDLGTPDLVSHAPVDTTPKTTLDSRDSRGDGHPINHT